MWDGQDHYDVIIQPGLMWAASFIPNNGLGALPPQNWQGGMTIECLKSTPFGEVDATGEIVPFFLAAFNHWHNGINIPFRKEVGSTGIMSKTSWQFAYAIPYFDDSQGATERIWTTGVELNNQGPDESTGKLVYTIAQTYQQKGQQFTIPFSVRPYAKLRFDLYLGNPGEGVFGLKDVGYPEGLDREAMWISSRTTRHCSSHPYSLPIGNMTSPSLKIGNSGLL